MVIRAKKETFLAIQFFLFYILSGLLPKFMVQGIFVLQILYFTWYYIKKQIIINRCFCRSKEGKDYYRFFILFIILAFFYLCISIFNLPQLWGIKKLWYDFSYIFRHFIIILEMIVAIGLGYLLYKTDFIRKITNKQIILTFIFISIVSVTQVYAIGYTGLMVLLISLYAIRKKKKIFIFLIPFVFTEQTAFILASILFIFLIYFRKAVVFFIRKNTRIKLIFFLIFCSIAIVVLSALLYKIILKDPNSLWRLLVWADEVGSLIETNGTGVGFGTAYVTENIINTVDNSNMYMDEKGNYYSGFFLVANHNTFLNMFYRMGIIGGILFLALNIQIVNWCIKAYIKMNKKAKIYIWWGLLNFLYNTIIILLNPGLEMIQFAINYITSLAIFIAVLLKSNEHIKYQLQTPFLSNHK